MNSLTSNKQPLVPIVGAVMIVVGIELPVTAATLTPEPLFNSSASYSTTIPRNEGGTDAAEIYYPTEPDVDSDTTSLPIALFLQGALVDKSDYSNFASTIARYGFVVVVPNHIRTAINPMGAITGLIAEQQQVNDVLTYMVAENSNLLSPVAGLLDSDTLVLLGHSFGGAVGLAAIQDNCFPTLCTGQFNRPSELKGGAFYGTNFLIGQGTGLTSPIDNDGIPIALIQGSLDSVATPSRAEATYSRIQDSPKAFITVAGANHYGITNQDNPSREPVRPTLEQDVVTETVARWSALFLRGTVLNDSEAFDYVFNTGDVLDENVSVVSEPKSVPEPASIWSLLGLGAIGTSLLLMQKQKFIKS